MKILRIATMLLLIAVLSNCEINGSYLGVSRSISESKQDGFLVRVLTPETTTISLDTLGNLRLKEAFIEKVWRSNSDVSKSSTSSHQLIITFEDTIPSKYSFDWEMEIQRGRKFTEQNESCLVAEISDFNFLDSITIKIYVGDVFYRDANLKPFQSITLK